MSVPLVVIRLELADQSLSPQGFQYSAVEGRAEEEKEDMQEKALGLAKAALTGKTDQERETLLRKHIGSRAMGDMVIETFDLTPGGVEGEDTHGSRGEETPEAQCLKAETDCVEGCEEGIKSQPSLFEQLSDQISFYSGHPSVEIVRGIMHLYKTDKTTSLTEDVSRSAMLCLLAVPATMTSHDLMKLVSPYNAVMEHMKIIRDSTPNQFMVLLKFSTQADADGFYAASNGRQFNSIEDAVCHLVYVDRAEAIKSEQGASLPVMGLTELPKCTVCLEGMDESVNGVLTTLCNHSFHIECLQRWEDASCPVCRHRQTPESVEENKCFECGVQANVWICLICGHVGCGRYDSVHALKHFEETQHTYAMNLTNQRVWDYAGDNYVHRLVANTTDGKMVQYESKFDGDICHAEKMEALGLEYTYLLTSQLDSQRIYWENLISRLEKDTADEINNMKAKFSNVERQLAELTKERQRLDKKRAQVNGRVTKLSQELTAEQEMNRSLRANQLQLQAQLAAEQRKARESEERKDRTITELQDQLRDLMFSLEVQQQIERLPTEARSEIQEGQLNVSVNLGAGPSSSVRAGKRGHAKKRK